MNKQLPKANIVVKAIAELLVDVENSDDFEKQFLEKEKLDYSVESLRYIDQYLDKARSKKKSINDEQYSKIILRCGAYSGEVIKKNSQKKFSWITFSEAVKKHKNIRSYGESLLTAYMLEEENSKMLTFPMAKIEKYLNNGKEDSLYYYAQVLVTR